MSQQPPRPDQQPRITLTKTDDYRDSYANSVQIRLSMWDLMLIFGTLDTPAPDEVHVTNFQGVYLSPQQAKALLNVLAHNVSQYEQTFGPISLDGSNAEAHRYTIPPNGPVH